MSALRHYLSHTSFPYPQRATARPVAANAYAAAQAVSVSLETSRWLERFGVVSGREARRTLLRMESGKLAGTAFSYADPSVVRLCSDLIAWLLVFGEHDVSMRRRDPSGLDALHRRLADGLASRATSIDEDPFVASLCDLFRRLDERAPERWIARLTSSILRFVDGRACAARFRERRVTPTVDEYLTFRDRSLATFPMIDLVELASEAYLSEELATSARMDELKRLASLVMSSVHDIFASVRESREQASQNLVMVLARDRGLVNRVALDEAVAMHNVLLDCFHDHRNAHFGALAKADPAVEGFVFGVQIWFQANYDWCSEIPRYADVSFSGWEFVLRCCEAASMPPRFVSQG